MPSDILAGCILLRVKQKKETREMRRIQMLDDDGPKYCIGNKASRLSRRLLTVVIAFQKHINNRMLEAFKVR